MRIEENKVNEHENILHYTYVHTHTHTHTCTHTHTHTYIYIYIYIIYELRRKIIMIENVLQKHQQGREVYLNKYTQHHTK